MNFLAHLVLARPTEESRVGNLLGDFAKGTIASLTPLHSPAVLEGIRQHRAIDRFTDSHPTFEEAKKLIAPQRQRLTGIVVDIFYDHFLSLDWPLEEKRPEFIQKCYISLENHKQVLTPELQGALPYMRQQDWLGAYATREGIQLTLQRVQRRSPKLVGIEESFSDFTENYDAFYALFRSFYPELISFNGAWLADATSSLGSR